MLATFGAPPVVKLWSAVPQYGTVKGVVQGAATFEGSGRVYTWEGGEGFFDTDILRAFEADGRSSWSQSLEGKVLQVSGDPGGGVAVLVVDRTDGYTTRLMHFPAVGSPWQLEGAGRFAVHPDGPLYYVTSEGALRGMDIGFGPGWYAPLPGGRHGTPTVLEDGSVVVPQVQGEEGAWTLQFFVLRPDGVAEIRSTDFWSAVEDLTPLKAVPNGRGGLLVQLQGWAPSAPVNAFPYWATVVGVDSAGTVTGEFNLGEAWGELIVAEDGLAAASTYVSYLTLFGARQRHLGVLTTLTAEGQYVSGTTYPPAGSCNGWDFINYANCPGQIDITSIAAAGGGGAVLSLSNGQVFGSHPVFEQMAMSHVTSAGDGTYLGVAGGSLTRMSGPALPEPKSPWPGTGGGAQAANAAARPGTGIFVKGHEIGLTPYNHASIRVAPRNIGRWYEKAESLFYRLDERSNIIAPNLDEHHNRFFTFGAGPDAAHDVAAACVLSPRDVIAVLTSGINRGADVTAPAAEIARTFYSPLMERRPPTSE